MREYRREIRNQKLEIRKVGMRFLFLSLGFFAFLILTPPSWAGKSLWELRGQTTEQTEESSPTPSTAVVSAVKTEPQAPQTAEEAKTINPEIAAFIDSIQIPSQYGRIKEKFVGSDPRMFVLMQEIHNHPEVQKNNKEIMAILLDQYKMPLILVEGHSGQVESSLLLSRPKKWREAIAKERIEKGYFDSEEYLYLTREVPPTIIGVDDEKVVKEQYDLVHYKFLLENRKRTEVLFSQLNQSIEIAKEKLYNAALKAFDVNAQEYTEDKISAEEYISILNQAIHDYQWSFSETNYPNIALVVKGSELEKENKYEESQEYLQKVDHAKLFAEIKGLEKEIRTKLYKNAEEARLDKLAKALYYFEKLGKISLVPLEWEEYIYELSPFNVQNLRTFLIQNGISISATTEEIVFLDQYRKEGEIFYQIAIDRERAMVENSLAVLSKRNVTKAILKTGGFHTSGIVQFLRANRISYVVVAPRVTQPDMPTPYQELLKGSMEKVSKTISDTPNPSALGR